jgi:peptide-methionine (S)-S-oxide reductase
VILPHHHQLGRRYNIGTGIRITFVIGLLLAAVVPVWACGEKTGQSDEQASATVEVNQDMSNLEKATFAAGCFWGIEAAFRKVEGVVSTRVGYTGGKTEAPTYQQVCSDRTGHAEAVEVTYDPEMISYHDLLKVFWSIHDPTQRNRQGPDVGSQYRSAIFYHNEAQADAARTSKADLEKSGKHKKPIATEIIPAREFYAAEDYHQQYYEKRGMGGCATSISGSGK